MRAGLKRIAAASELWMTWMAAAMSYLYTDTKMMSRKIILSVQLVARPISPSGQPATRPTRHPLRSSQRDSTTCPWRKGPVCSRAGGAAVRRARHDWRYLLRRRGECALLCSGQAGVDNRSRASYIATQRGSLMTEVPQRLSTSKTTAIERSFTHFFCRFEWGTTARCRKSATSYGEAESPIGTAVGIRIVWRTDAVFGPGEWPAI